MTASALPRTAVTVDVARKLDGPTMVLMVNKVPAAYSAIGVKQPTLFDRTMTGVGYHALAMPLTESDYFQSLAQRSKEIRARRPPKLSAEELLECLGGSYCVPGPLPIDAQYSDPETARGQRWL